MWSLDRAVFTSCDDVGVDWLCSVLGVSCMGTHHGKLGPFRQLFEVSRVLFGENYEVWRDSNRVLPEE